MGDHSLVPEELVSAYRNTEFRCGLDVGSMVLRVGVQSAALAELYESSGRCCAAFITACSPRSEPTADEVNRALHRALGFERAELGFAVVEGAGVDPTGQWPAEPSYFVLGIDLETASALGRRYEQNAIVWVGADAVPQLVLLR